jgi:hypothetical protein
MAADRYGKFRQTALTMASRRQVAFERWDQIRHEPRRVAQECLSALGYEEGPLFREALA